MSFVTVNFLEYQVCPNSKQKGNATRTAGKP
nr:MAG TPA: hypothetical protein [Caudoviricetes sp.]